MKKPFIGAIVHYHMADNKEVRAAIVVEVLTKDAVKLQVFSPNSSSSVPLVIVHYSDYGTGTYEWSWPPPQLEEL